MVEKSGYRAEFIELGCENDAATFLLGGFGPQEVKRDGGEHVRVEIGLCL